MEEHIVWDVHRMDGLEKTWCCLSISARDLVKSGWLYLRNGDWEGTQIVSSDRLKKSMTQGAYQPSECPSISPRFGWLLSEEGKDEQYWDINLKKNLIVIRLGEQIGKLP